MSEEEVDNAMSEMDGDGNGSVSLHEFNEYFTSHALGNVTVSETRSDLDDQELSDSMSDFDFRATKKARVSRSADVPDGWSATPKR